MSSCNLVSIKLELFLTKNVLFKSSSGRLVFSGTEEGVQNQKKNFWRLDGECEVFFVENNFSV